MTEDDIIDILGFGFLLVFLPKSFCNVLYTMDETTIILLKVVEDKDTAIKELSKQPTGYYTCTRVLLEQINYNLVSRQTSSVGDNFESYEIKVGELVGRIDLLESN